MFSVKLNQFNEFMFPWQSTEICICFFVSKLLFNQAKGLLGDNNAALEDVIC